MYFIQNVNQYFLTKLNLASCNIVHKAHFLFLNIFWNFQCLNRLFHYFTVFKVYNQIRSHLWNYFHLIYLPLYYLFLFMSYFKTLLIYWLVLLVICRVFILIFYLIKEFIFWAYMIIWKGNKEVYELENM